MDSVKVLGEGGSLDSKFCARKKLKMELFVVLKTNSSLSFKQMLDAVTDGKPMDFKVFQSSLGFFLSKISFTEFSLFFPSKIFNMILTFFANFFVNVKL